MWKFTTIYSVIIGLICWWSVDYSICCCIMERCIGRCTYCIITPLPKKITSLILTTDRIVPTTSSYYYQKIKQSFTTSNLPRLTNQKLTNLDPNTLIKNIITDSYIHNPQRSTIHSTPHSTENNYLNISLNNCTHLQSSMYESDHFRSNKIGHPLSPPSLYYI